jgi:hypothetical protein
MRRGTAEVVGEFDEHLLTVFPPAALDTPRAAPAPHAMTAQAPSP